MPAFQVIQQVYSYRTNGHRGNPQARGPYWPEVTAKHLSMGENNLILYGLQALFHVFRCSGNHPTNSNCWAVAKQDDFVVTYEYG